MAYHHQLKSLKPSAKIKIVKYWLHCDWEIAFSIPCSQTTNFNQASSSLPHDVRPSHTVSRWHVATRYERLQRLRISKRNTVLLANRAEVAAAINQFANGTYLLSTSSSCCCCLCCCSCPYSIDKVYSSKSMNYFHLDYSPSALVSVELVYMHMVWMMDSILSYTSKCSGSGSGTDSNHELK